jgi:hypothetical protein
LFVTCVHILNPVLIKRLRIEVERLKPLYSRKF